MLKAVAYRNGEVIGNFILATPEEPGLVIDVDRTELKADGEDLAFCKIHFADAAGNDDLYTSHTIAVTVEGVGTLEALGNANPSSEDVYDIGQTSTYDGYCLAVVRAGEELGEIKVTVTVGETVTKAFEILTR